MNRFFRSTDAMKAHVAPDSRGHLRNQEFDHVYLGGKSRQCRIRRAECSVER